MPDYEKMYFILFNCCTDIIEILKKATLETEKLAMEAKDSVILPIAGKDKNNEEKA